MGSGPSAFRESDMVVELMQKFMEAGFPQETAIRMMNSAMVLQEIVSLTLHWILWIWICTVGR